MSVERFFYLPCSFSSNLFSPVDIGQPLLSNMSSTFRRSSSTFLIIQRDGNSDLSLAGA